MLDNFDQQYMVFQRINKFRSLPEFDAIFEKKQGAWLSLIHISACVRILRRYIDRIGFKNDFSIYDTDDSKKVIREIIKGLNLDSKMYRESSVLGLSLIHI